ncbi:hypothetical protein QR680_002998 [Steinernema hermaphroditum]|uniref:Uncharacterized protein n=1 Tax=Steinernema hermaphroditum TaxID=289476 RepID=A0AA39H5X4_9BILA|nr:hypothetical protein QR680_002998 [Steinernema hermaphroditum]
MADMETEKMADSSEPMDTVDVNANIEEEEAASEASQTCKALVPRVATPPQNKNSSEFAMNPGPYSTITITDPDEIFRADLRNLKPTVPGDTSFLGAFKDLKLDGNPEPQQQHALDADIPFESWTDRSKESISARYSFDRDDMLMKVTEKYEAMMSARRERKREAAARKQRERADRALRKAFRGLRKSKKRQHRSILEQYLSDDDENPKEESRADHPGDGEGVESAKKRSSSEQTRQEKKERRARRLARSKKRQKKKEEKLAKKRSEREKARSRSRSISPQRYYYRGSPPRDARTLWQAFHGVDAPIMKSSIPPPRCTPRQRYRILTREEVLPPRKYVFPNIQIQLDFVKMITAPGYIPGQFTAKYKAAQLAASRAKANKNSAFSSNPSGEILMLQLSCTMRTNAYDEQMCYLSGELELEETGDSSDEDSEEDEYPMCRLYPLRYLGNPPERPHPLQYANIRLTPEYEEMEEEEDELFQRKKTKLSHCSSYDQLNRTLHQTNHVLLQESIGSKVLITTKKQPISEFVEFCYDERQIASASATVRLPKLEEIEEDTNEGVEKLYEELIRLTNKWCSGCDKKMAFKAYRRRETGQMKLECLFCTYVFYTFYADGERKASAQRMIQQVEAEHKKSYQKLKRMTVYKYAYTKKSRQQLAD